MYTGRRSGDIMDGRMLVIACLLTCHNPPTYSIPQCRTRHRYRNARPVVLLRHVSVISVHPVQISNYVGLAIGQSSFHSLLLAKVMINNHIKPSA
jgi:hypothetical protein